MLNKWIKLSLLWLGLIALVLFHYVTGITPLILKADTFDSYVDYNYYDVPNFDDYTPILKDTTPNLEFYLMSEFSTDFEVSYCPPGGYVAGVAHFLGVYEGLTFKYQLLQSLPDLYCIEPYESYSYTIETPLTKSTMGELFINNIINLDDDYMRFNNLTAFQPQIPMYGYNISFSNTYSKTWLEIRFNNNYLMSTFLLDSDFQYSTVSGVQRPFVLYTETENDRYNVYNDNLSTTIESRNKYAITIPDITSALVVNKIGTGWETKYNNRTITATSSTFDFTSLWSIYTFNATPMPTPFDDVAIDTTPNYSVCDYVLGFPIDCTLDGVPIGSFQAMANDLWEWTIKESPIFSDVWTLASGGFQWLSNTFQFLGYFDVNSLLGGILALLIGVIVMLWAWVGG